MNLRHITLHQLRLFHSLGRHRSFTQAAEELHLSQPAMSIQIKRLEESIGLPMVEKIGKQLFLTEAGNALFVASQDILNRLDALQENMLGMEAGVQGPINIAAITTAKYFMPHLLGFFMRDYPDIVPNLTITNQSKIIQRLQENHDDLVIMGTVPRDMGLEAEYFLDNPLVVIAPKDHPLASRKHIPLERIAKERFISREKGSGTREARRRLFEQHGLEDFKGYMELGSAEAIKQAVIAGLGISVLSKHNIRLEQEAGLLTILDVQHFPLMRKWYAVHHKDKKLSNTTRHFLDFLLNDGARIWGEISQSRILPLQNWADLGVSITLADPMANQNSPFPKLT